MQRVSLFLTEEPQYFIESDKTDHRATHKGSALKEASGEL
jgi:hypothetical protein